MGMPPETDSSHLEYARLVLDDVVDPNAAVEGKEGAHDGSECVAYLAGAELLYAEEKDDNGNGNAYNRTWRERKTN